MKNLIVFFTFAFFATPLSAFGAECGPGAPAGVNAPEMSIVVNICSPGRMYVGDQQYDSETIIDGIQEAMNKNKKTPLKIYFPESTESELKSKLIDLVISAPKGSSFVVTKDDGTSAGWQS